LADAEGPGQAQLGSGEQGAGVRALRDVAEDVRLDVRDVAARDRQRSLQRGARDAREGIPSDLA
jgi:hypothetical protein